jgi:tetratricopeptide (TPR) repeat protein
VLKNDDRPNVSSGTATSNARSASRARRWAAPAALAVVLLAAAGYWYVNQHVDGPDRRFQRALRALGRDDFERARRELVRLQALPSYEPHASLISGILLLQDEKFEAAMVELRFAADHADTRALARTLMGKTCYLRHRFHDAEQNLLAALQFDPDQAEAHRLLGVAYFDVGDLARSDTHLRRAAELVGDDARPDRILGAICREAKDHDGAIRHYQESLRREAGRPGQLKPSDRQEVLLELAACQAKLLRHDDALATLQAADETPDSLALAAECHQGLGDARRADEWLGRALALDPNHYPSLLAAGWLALESNDPAKAVELLERALEQRPRDPSLHYKLSRAHQSLGHDEMAERYARTFEELEELGQEYAKLLERAMQQPKQPDTCFQLGLAAERIGMSDEAASWYRVTLSLDAAHEGAQGRLAEMVLEEAARPAE